MSRRVVVLSPGGRFAAEVLARLEERGRAADALLVYRPDLARDWRGAPPADRRPFRAPLFVGRWLAGRARDRFGARLRAGARRAVFTGPLNGPRMRRDLERLRPDAVVLARCGLVSPEVLAVPADGVVNVHPALLPWIRGNNPLGNSLLRGTPLGATAFRVDAGIDTGRILERRLVAVAGYETAAGLRDALHRVWVEMTVDWIVAAGAAPLPTGEPQTARFPLCRTLSTPAELAAVDEAVRSGAAGALFDRWRPLCGPDLALAPGVHPEPVPHAVPPARP
ncbi:MAG TPA: formyltransferase family protein [Longimicrobium sp.]